MPLSLDEAPAPFRFDQGDVKYMLSVVGLSSLLEQGIHLQMVGMTVSRAHVALASSVHLLPVSPSMLGIASKFGKPSSRWQNQTNLLIRLPANLRPLECYESSGHPVAYCF